MDKEKRKELRKLRRAERKELINARRAKFNEIAALAGTFSITVDLDKDEPDFVDAFNQFWPILKPVLEYAELGRITGAGADMVLRNVIELGERVSIGEASLDEQEDFIAALDTAWEPLKAVLGILMTFTDDKVDQAINKIIEIGDWITDS